MKRPDAAPNPDSETHGGIASCPSCRHANRPTARFCEACGEAVGPRCPRCGWQCRQMARHCEACASVVE